MMDLFDSITEKTKEEITPELFDQIGEAPAGQDLFEMVSGGPEAEKPAAPVPWEETTPGYMGEITRRAPILSGPMAAIAPFEGRPMPTIGRVRERPFVEEEKPAFIKDVAWGTARKFGETALGAGEALASAAGGVLEFLNPLPGLAGTAETIMGGPEAGAQKIARWQEIFRPLLMYEPQTEEGKRGKQLIDSVFGLLRDAGQLGGGYVYDNLAPVIGKDFAAAVAGIIGGTAEILPIMVGGSILHNIPAKIKAGTPLTFKERAAVDSLRREVAQRSQKIHQDLAALGADDPIVGLSDLADQARGREGSLNEVPEVLPRDTVEHPTIEIPAYEMTFNEFLRAEKGARAKGSFLEGEPAPELGAGIIAPAVRTKTGEIYFDPAQTNHSGVIESHKLNLDNVDRGGWMIEGKWFERDDPAKKYVASETNKKAVLVHRASLAKAIAEGKDIPYKVFEDARKNNYPEVKRLLENEKYDDLFIEWASRTPLGEKIKPAEGAPFLILTGGPPGAGKTTGKSMTPDIESIAINIDSDSVKASVNLTGPDIVKYHEPSSRIAKKILDYGDKGNFNIVYDSHLKNFPLMDTMIQKTLSKEGRVALYFTNIDAETSMVRSGARSMANKATGKPFRDIPPSVVLEGYNWSLPTFIELYKKYEADPRVDFRMYDNNVDFANSVPVFEKVNSTGPSIFDHALFQEIMGTEYGRIVTPEGTRYERTTPETAETLKGKLAAIAIRQGNILARRGIPPPEPSRGEPLGATAAGPATFALPRKAPTEEVKKPVIVRTAWSQPTGKVEQHSTAVGLSKTPEYQAAKAGDLDAALKIASTLINPGKVREVNNLLATEKNVRVVPVRSFEAEGRNQIPAAFAELMAKENGWTVDRDIFQINRPERTSKGALERLFAQPVFDGKIDPKATYVLVDDMVSTGGTLANLKGFIESQGGKVAAVHSLRGTKFSTNLALSPETKAGIEKAYGEDLTLAVNHLFGRETDAGQITEAEGRAILAHRDAILDAARVGLTEARRGAPEGFRPGVVTEKPSGPAPAPPPEIKPSGPEKTPIEAPGKAAGPEIIGETTTILTSEGQDQAVYKVIEADQITPSHQVAKGFSKNPEYPLGIQERPYEVDKAEQLKVITHGQQFEPRFLVSDNPDAINGPPIITKDGLVLGGNSRAMTLQWIYENRPEAATKYKIDLLNKAGLFGIDAARLDSMKNPVLVRELVNDMTDSIVMARKARLYNQPFTQGLNLTAESISKAKMISPTTMEDLSLMLEKFDTLADLYRSNDSRRLIEGLRISGAIDPTQLNRLVNRETGLLNEEGKAFVTRLIRGKVLDDFNLLDNMEAGILQKIDKSLPSLATMKARGEGWDITPELKEALWGVQRFKASGFRTLKEYLTQQGMFGQENMATNPAIERLAQTIISETPTKIRDKFNRFAQAARADIPGQMAMDIGKPMQPEEAFNKFFVGKPESAQATLEIKTTPRGGLPLGLGGSAEIQRIYEVLTGQRRRTDPLPKYAQSINLERQSVKEGYKEFQADLADLMPEKKVQTWDESQKLADEILRDYSKITEIYKKVERGGALNTEEILAARTVNVTAINRLAEIAKDKSPEVASRYLKNYADRIFKLTSEASSEAGRALNIHKKFVAPARIAQALGKLKNGMNERQFKEFLDIAPLMNKEYTGLTDLELGRVQRFIDRLPDPKLADYFYEYWYNSILSGIPTHIVNFASNTMWQAWNIMIHHPIASGVDALISRFTGREQQIFFSEVFPMLAGIRSGIKKGWEGVKEVIRTGEAANFQNKWDRDIGNGIVSAFERSPNATLRAIAPYITTPSRALKAMDVWANSIAFDAKMNGLIHREGLRRGLEGDTLARFEQKFRPTDQMIDEAGKYAQYITFMEDPGPMNQLIMKARNTVWGGRLFVPFVNTIGNLLKRGIEMTPGVGLTLAKGKPIHEVLAKQIEGSIISLWILNKAFNGEVTGGVPDNPAEKEAFFRQKKLPWSVKIGDTWYQYRRFEPFNTVLASTAIVYDKLKHAKSQADAASIFFDCARGVWENLLDSSYLSGAIQMFQKHGNMASIGFRQAASLVPFSGFWRSVNRAVEAIAEDNAMVRDSKTFWGAFSQVIPGLYKFVEPKMDLWGEKVILPGGAFRQWLPYKWSEMGTDEVESELERLMVYPAQPQKSMMIGDMKIQIPEDFYRDYALHFGMVGKRRLERVLTSPGYGQARDEQKIKIIDHELRSIREVELMRAKREYLKRFGQPPEELNLRRRISP